MYINVGVRWTGSGDRIRTKGELKKALANMPDTVVFDKTSPLDSSGLPTQIKVCDLKGGMKLSVCGPNPYEKRQWWATVERKADGSVKVS